MLTDPCVRQTLNIADAYKDTRFNPNIDRDTGAHCDVCCTTAQTCRHISSPHHRFPHAKHSLYAHIRTRRGTLRLVDALASCLIGWGGAPQQKVIGVVQMVNKRGCVFTSDDERLFGGFAVYCALSVHAAAMFDKLVLSESKVKVCDAEM